MKIPLFCLLFLYTLLSGYWFAAIMIATWFIYWYPGWWLFIMAVLIDGYFGQFERMPALSLAMGAFVVFSEVLKIQLLGTRYE